MKTNGKPKTQNILANLVIPGADLPDSAYASLKLRLDCYDDYILAQKFKDGRGSGLYALDPLEVAAALAGVTLTTPLLPPGCLFWQRADGGERIAIYAGPQVWTVNVSTKDAKRKTWRVPMPGLVWVGQGVNYRLYAVKGTDDASEHPEGCWPTPETELFNAPCPNVSDGICRGNVNFPQASAATAWPALRLFFESDFNNHLTNGKSRAYGLNILTLWQKLAKAGAEAWPEDDLVSAGKTLKRVMK